MRPVGKAFMNGVLAIKPKGNNSEGLSKQQKLTVRCYDLACYDLILSVYLCVIDC